VWTSLVDLVRATIFGGSHLLGGSLGASVIVVSTVVRLALLPILLRSARHARAQQLKLAELKPQLERLRKRYQSDPRRLVAETQALYKQHGIRLMSGSSLASAAIQLPLLGALFSAVRTGLGARTRFLWIADLSRVDGILVLLVTALAGFAATLTPATPESPITPRMLTLFIVGGTLVFLWSASSAVALSVGAGSGVSVLQNWLLRRDAKRTPAAI
jgi:YidC/Oxa1 family membrane protein insertase